VLLEGRFGTAFKNRISPVYLQEGFEFREQSLPTSMLVISDGNIFQNRVSADRQNYFTLGYDRYAKRKVYGNREFLINAVNYMLDEASLISVRSRSIKLRQLDSEALIQNRTKIQTANVALPILLILVLGLILNFIRSRNYSKT
jgi:ABC-2 type transport system permease protein